MKATHSFIIVLFLYLPTWAIEIVESGYQVETYASYLCPDTYRNSPGIACDPFGNLYISHWENYEQYRGSIYRIDLDRVAKRLITGNHLPRKLVWTGLTDYGNVFYVAGAENTGIEMFDLLGNTTNFCDLSWSQAVALDYSGKYGGLLYSATRTHDHIYAITPAGTATRFSSFPGDVPGGPVDLCFDPGYKYGGLLYLASNSPGRPNSSGLFSIDPQGNVVKFTEALSICNEINFDFDGTMFVCGKTESETIDDPARIWQVSPSGMISEFARTTLDPQGFSSFTFGPDGSLFIPEFLEEYKLMIISRIVRSDYNM